MIVDRTQVAIDFVANVSIATHTKVDTLHVFFQFVDSARTALFFISSPRNAAFV